MDINEILLRITDKDGIPLMQKAYLFEKMILSKINYTDEKTIMNDTLSTVNVLLDFRADNLTIISALVYKTLNYGVTNEKIKKEFDDSVANIAAGIVKINNLERCSSNDYELYLKETLMDSPEEVRSLFIKLAERFYEMKNMQNLPEQYQKRIASETLNTLVPAASRLRLNFIRSRLEDLCLSYLNPQIYNEILKKLDADYNTLVMHLNSMKKDISDLLTENSINFVIKGRVKNVYSIYNKLCNGKSWEDIYDILALKIITDNEVDCMRIAQLIHSKHKSISSRFKNYISKPKENMYQSIHTTIIGEDNRFYEIQIRTHEMNMVDEKGTADHRLYKEKTRAKVK